MGKSIGALVLQLRTASLAYYAGQEIISDDEFDSLIEDLETLDPANPFLSEIGAPPVTGAWPQAEHVMHMGSQKKMTKFDELEKWWSKYTSGQLYWSEKLDGFSIELIYDNGQLAQGITRGNNGRTGEDITPNVKLMRVPKTIPTKDKVAVRCEVMLNLSIWEEHFPDTKNPRNVGAGIARRKDNPEQCKHLRCYGIDVSFVEDPKKFKTKAEVFHFLNEAGFSAPFSGLVAPGRQGVLEIQSIKEDYEQHVRGKLNYLIDGLVIEDNDLEEQAKQGIIDNRPRGARAYKFGSATAETILKDVVWQVGRTQITPVGILEPVELAGVTIERVTLCNLDEIKKLKVGLGSRVKISRRNDVIPKLEKSLSDGNPIHQPSECPSCGSPTEDDGIRLYCTGDDCGDQRVKQIVHYLDALDIKGLGPKQVERFVDTGLVVTPTDLYKLSPKDFESYKIGIKVLTDLRNKSREVPIELFIKSLGIHKFGRGKTEEILKVIPTLDGIRQATISQLEAIHLVGTEIAKAAVEGLAAKADLIDSLLEHVTLKDHTVVKEKPSGGPDLTDTAFCFTGVRNKTAEQVIKDCGGKIVSGVSSKTTHLVAKDLGSGSAKLKKAKELGLTILDEAGLASLLGVLYDEN